MDDDTYKGESPAKKLARVAFWDKTLTNLRRHEVRGGFLVLASREGGDISTLLALGVRPEGIIGVDINKEAADECQKKFPQVKIIHGDVCDVAAQATDQVAALFLDFCGPISPSLTKTLWRSAQRACKMNAIIGIGLLRGRERVVGSGQVERVRTIKKTKTNDEWDREMQRRHGLKPMSSFADDDDVPDDNRHAATWIDVAERARPFGWGVAPLGAITYQSNVGNSRGVPMIYGIARKSKLPIDISQEEYDQNIMIHIRPCDGDTIDTALRKTVALTASSTRDVMYTSLLFNLPAATVVEWVEENKKGKFGPLRPPRRKTDHLKKFQANGLAPMALPEATDVLDSIDAGTIAAWKAHATRGSYGR